MIKKAYFGGGCFWCTEAVFQRLRGVLKVVSGYSGGTMENPDYEAVCQGNTGHAEAIEIEFDDEQIDYSTLLAVFFSTHDPTSLNRQGNDQGTQYRSVVFYTDESQKKAAEEMVASLIQQKVYAQQIVTAVSPLEKFYPAEKYHQNYYNENEFKPYCQFVINPKLQKFQEKWHEYLKQE